MLRLNATALSFCASGMEEDNSIILAPDCPAQSSDRSVINLITNTIFTTARRCIAILLDENPAEWLLQYLNTTTAMQTISFVKRIPKRSQLFVIALLSCLFYSSFAWGKGGLQPSQRPGGYQIDSEYSSIQFQTHHHDAGYT